MERLIGILLLVVFASVAQAAEVTRLVTDDTGCETDVRNYIARVGTWDVDVRLYDERDMQVVSPNSRLMKAMKKRQAWIVALPHIRNRVGSYDPSTVSLEVQVFRAEKGGCEAFFSDKEIPVVVPRTNMKWVEFTYIN